MYLVNDNLIIWFIISYYYYDISFHVLNLLSLPGNMGTPVVLIVVILTVVV